MASTNPILRSLARVMVVFALAGSLLVATQAPPAEASARKCNVTIPNGWGCFEVFGAGLGVLDHEVERAFWSGFFPVCNYQAKIKVSYDNGGYLYSMFSSYHAGCSQVGWFDFGSWLYPGNRDLRAYWKDTGTDNSYAYIAKIDIDA